MPSRRPAPRRDATKLRKRAGILDDLIYFIDEHRTRRLHPALAQGTRRGDKFDVVRLADDVEDMQIAYGVDTDGNGALNRAGPADAHTTPTRTSRRRRRRRVAAERRRRARRPADTSSSPQAPANPAHDGVRAPTARGSTA